MFSEDQAKRCADVIAIPIGLRVKASHESDF